MEHSEVQLQNVDESHPDRKLIGCLPNMEFFSQDIKINTVMGIVIETN